MSMNDEFYSHFPSLNSNSKENQRYKRITRDYSDYVKNNINRDSPKAKQQQRTRRSRENVSVSTSSGVSLSSPSMDVIFSAEERNQFENEQKEERRKVYQQTLELQIEEQRLKKQREFERLQREEMILEKRLQRQIEAIKLEKDPQDDQVVERISLSESENDSYKIPLAEHNVSTQSNNDVYRYFSHSAKVDSKLFNYRKYFSDIAVDPVVSQQERTDTVVAIKPAKSNELALKIPAAKNMPKIDSCHCTTECSRCHKKLEMVCKECTEHSENSPETTNQLEIEYNEPGLPFTPDQQVVAYTASDDYTPYSFNIDPDSQFYKDTLREVQEFSEAKLANYVKLYGDLRKTKTHDKEVDKHPKATGAIPKRKPLIDKVSDKNIANNTSDFEDILNSAQVTVITQLGFAKKQLENL